MNIEYLQSEIDKYQLAIDDDKKKKELIDLNLKYNERALKNAKRAFQELTKGKEK